MYSSMVVTSCGDFPFNLQQSVDTHSPLSWGFPLTSCSNQKSKSYLISFFPSLLTSKPSTSLLGYTFRIQLNLCTFFHLHCLSLIQGTFLCDHCSTSPSFHSSSAPCPQPVFHMVASVIYCLKMEMGFMLMSPPTITPFCSTPVPQALMKSGMFFYLAYTLLLSTYHMLGYILRDFHILTHLGWYLYDVDIPHFTYKDTESQRC